MTVRRFVVARCGGTAVLVGCAALVGLSRPEVAALPGPADSPPSSVREGTRPVGFPAPPEAAVTQSSSPEFSRLPMSARPGLPGLIRRPFAVERVSAQVPDPPPKIGVDPPMIQPNPKPFPVRPDASGLDRRLAGLGGPVGSTPKPTPAMKARFGKYVDQIVDPENTLDLVVNRNRLLIFKAAPKRVQIADEAVAAMTVVTPREVSITGKAVGTTVLTLWFTDAVDPNKQEVLSYLVRVVPDPEYKERVDRVYEALAGEINRAFPDSAVKLQLLGDKLVLSGHAKDAYEAFQILRVARANAPGQAQTLAANIPVTQLNVTLPPDALAPGGGGVEGVQEVGLANYVAAGGPNVINLLRVGGEQQVMLKVTVAEVNRAAARSVGINFAIARTDGLIVFANRTGGIATGMSGGAGGGVSISPLNNLPILIGGGQVAAAVNALKTLNLAKSLAEPTLTTLNGRPASFQSGGQFPVPVVTGFTAAGLQGVTYVPFGVSLNFTPVVTDDDLVRMTVNAEVSTRDASTSQTNINGASVPSLNSRNFQTTVELRAGETLAVAGLIQNNFASDATRVPFLGGIPVVGRLFAFDRTAKADQELVILITPYLVHPLNKHELKPLPGEDLISPTDLGFYLLGRLQQYPETAAKHTNADTARRRKCEQQLLIGPVGYTDGR